VPPPDISIIIVSWNVRERLRACLRSLPQPGGGVETIVVDAASADGTREMVRAEFPSVLLIARADNVGYSRGNNLGLAQARGRYAFILNPDTEPRVRLEAELIEEEARDRQVREQRAAEPLLERRAHAARPFASRR